MYSNGIAEQLHVWRPSAPSLVLGCLILLALALYELWFRTTPAYRMLRNMPGPLVLPLIGNAHLIFGLTDNQMVERAFYFLREYGETVRGVLGNKLIVFLTNPADIELILNSQVHLTKSEEYDYFRPWFGNGLLISTGAHWRHHRRLIAPTFHQSILKSFVPRFDAHAQRVAQRLEASGLGDGITFDVHEQMSQVSVEILLSTVMGMRRLPPAQRCLDYAKAVLGMCNVIHQRQLQLPYRVDVLYRCTKMYTRGEQFLAQILALSKDVIGARKRDFDLQADSIVDSDVEYRQQQPLKETAAVTASGPHDDLDELDETLDNVGAKQRLALLDAMVAQTKRPKATWSEQDVVDEVNTIMFEGHDTTAAASSFVLCLLGVHQQVQARVYAEQLAIFGGDLQRDCSFNDTLDMHYLERVIKETMRLYPPVPVIARRVTEDVPLASGPYTIPRGCTVVLGQYAVHRRSENFKQPDVFDPDNFLPERVAGRHYYGYIPFSAGPRSCVGRKYAMLMLKVLLSTLLRRFTVHCDMREEDFRLQGDIILKLEQGFNIRLQRRRDDGTKS